MVLGGGGVDAFAGVDNGELCCSTLVKQTWKEDLISYHNGYVYIYIYIVNNRISPKVSKLSSLTAKEHVKLPALSS